MKRGPFWGAALRALLLLMSVSACGEERVNTLTSSLALRTLSDCSPNGTSQITIEALGDYRASEQSFAAIDGRAGMQTLSALPLGARLARASVTNGDFRGIGIAPIADRGERFDALVLPLFRACTVIDRGVTLRPFASATLIGGEDILIAGGTNAEGVAETKAFRIVVAEQRMGASLDTFVPRTRALALDLGGEAWILGGAQSDLEKAPAFDTYERFNRETGSFGVLGRMAQKRLSPGGVVLSDGSVLLVGGASEVGSAALDSLERVFSAEAKGRLLAARLPRPMLAPRVLERDDGLVVIAANTPEFTLALYDPESDTLRTLNSPNTKLDSALVVTVAGARTAIVESDQGFTTGALYVLDAGGNAERLTGSLTSFSGLARARSIALRDGRILLTGEIASRSAARVIDPGTMSVSSVSVDVVPEQLLLREDGAVLLIASDRVSVLRLNARTIYDSPGGTLLGEDDGVLALDAKGHFAREGLLLRAQVDGARLDLAGLSYEDVTIEVEATAGAELLLRRVAGAERAIEVGDSSVGPALCTIAHQRGARVAIARSGARVEISTGDEHTRCALEGLDERIAIGLRVRDRGTVLKWLSITRR